MSDVEGHQNQEVNPFDRLLSKKLYYSRHTFTRPLSTNADDEEATSASYSRETSSYAFEPSIKAFQAPDAVYVAH